MRKLSAVLAALLVRSIAGCGYNPLQRNDENITSSGSEVVKQYLRQADLLPNLVRTVCSGFV